MAVAMLLVAGLMLAQAPARQADPARVRQPDPARVRQADPARVAEGRRLYVERKCATCHMIAGEGNIRFTLDRVASRLSSADLGRWLTDTGAMERALPKQPAVRMSEWLSMNKKMTDADVAALVAYLSTLK